MPLYKISKIITIIIGVIGCVFLGMVIAKGDADISESSAVVSNFIHLAKLTLWLTIGLVIIFVVYGLITTGNLKKTFIPIAAFLVVVAISYALADGTPMQLREGDSISGSGAKWVDTGLYAFYIMAIVAIGAMVYSSIKNAIR